MVGELKFVVTGERVNVACIFVLSMAIKSIPVIFLDSGCAFTQVETGPLEA